jgi:hypothetical protein
MQANQATDKKTDPRPEQASPTMVAPAVQARAAQAQSAELMGGRGAVVQLKRIDEKGRDKARDQHEKRGKDNPTTRPKSQYASFGDHDGKPTVLKHDHGHLDDGKGNLDPSKRQEATWGDYWERAKWIAKLEAAELLRPDLVDGTSAYRHFLFGKGRKRDIHYQRFINNDTSGARVFQSIVEDARFAAIKKHDAVAGADPKVGKTSFKLKTGRIGVGNDGRYPYPATENWQKAIGAHSLWMELDVTVTVKEVPGKGPPDMCVPPTLERTFDVKITTHVEDMYNFNPGMSDIATGTPDSANGRFEITGLGHEYLNYSDLTHTIEFTTDMQAASRGPDDSKNVDVGRSGREGRAEGGRGRAAER